MSNKRVNDFAEPSVAAHMGALANWLTAPGVPMQSPAGLLATAGEVGEVNFDEFSEELLEFVSPPL